MSDAVSTRLDRPYAQQPETRAAATAYLERSGNGDLLAVLGLVDAPEPAPPGTCADCGNLLPGHGVCRRTQRCRETAQEAGVIA